MPTEPDLRTWEAWKGVHQPFELGWWKEYLHKGPVSDPGFTNWWVEVKAWIEPVGEIIDIGCGPRPPFAPCVAIEPLADEYKAIVPTGWWDGVEAYAQPAEEDIVALHGAGDTIICWNCLDHLIGWRDVLRNMRAYGAPNARFAVSTDFWPPFVGHPGFDRDEFLAEIDAHFHVHKRREPFGRMIALLMTAKDAGL